MTARFFGFVVVCFVMWCGPAAACFIVLHTPNGHHFSVRAESIEVIRPIDQSQHDHLPPHTNSVVFFGGKNHGVRETEEDVINLRMKCRR